MNFKELLSRLDPDIYQRLKTSLELGKWPDGRSLTQEQKELTMEAIIAYEIQHDFPENQRVGYVDTTGSACHADEEKPLVWKH